MSNDHDVGVLEGTLERRDELLFCRSIHALSSFRLAGPLREKRQRRGATCRPAVIGRGDFSAALPPMRRLPLRIVPKVRTVASAPCGGSKLCRPVYAGN